MLSAVIITKNAADTLGMCLESLKFADEIVVLDCGSEDRTTEIAEFYGAKLSRTIDWPGFGKQKNKAIDLASHDWVLSIDADEVVSPELQAEILQVTSRPPSNTAFQLKRLSWFCGKPICHSGWQNDWVLRLFARGNAKFSEDLVHERLVTQDKIIRLGSPLYHYSFNTFEEVIEKMDRYSSASALQLFMSHRKASVYKAVAHGTWAFVRTYFIKFGFLDGPHGLALAIANAEGTYYRYLKLWHLNNKNH